MAMQDSKKKWLNIRLLLLLLIVLGGFVWLCIQVYTVQVSNTEFYRNKVADELLYEGTLPAERGLIYDAAGEELAVNETKYRIFISPGDIAKMTKAAREAKEAGETYAEEKLDTARFIADNLSVLIGMTPEELYALTEDTDRYDVTVVKEADRALADSVTAFRETHALGYTVNVESYSKRAYLYGNLASHVLGFLGNEGNGAYGLEYYYNDLLTGTDGRYTALTDSTNHVIGDAYKTYIAAKNGANLNLCLDRTVQEVLEDKVKAAALDAEAANGAFGVVLNAKTGGVLGMAVYPDYDCNNPRELTGYYAERLAVDSAANLWKEEDKDYLAALSNLQMQMWSNRAVNFPYIPGSTFKVITFGIALETGSQKISDTYTCRKYITSVDGVTRIQCSSTYGHGTLTFAQGLQQSCNPWFITAGLKIGTATFYNYMENLGYLRTCGIDLPGESETIFWPRNSFTPADLETCAFGQNFKVTAVRHLACLSAVANDGYAIAPHVVDSVTDADGGVLWKYQTQENSQLFCKSVTDTVSEILAEGVAGNGGSANAYVSGYKVAAKTGTSEKIGDADEENKICSCFAYAPYDDPEVIMIIVVDSPKDNKNSFGNTVAAPYVAETLAEILPYLGVMPEYTEEEQQKLNVTIADYKGKSAQSAREQIEKAGLQCEFRGTGDYVTAQMPAEGNQLSKDGGRVVLYLGDSAPEKTVSVPDYVGMTAQDAKNAILRVGLNLEETGMTKYGSKSVVVRQSVPAGTLLAPGEIVSLSYRSLSDGDD